MTISGTTQTTPARPPSTTPDYPPLCYAAETASRTGQTWYVRLIRANVGLIILGALIGSLSTLGPAKWQEAAAVISAVAIATGILMRWVNRARRPDRSWFDGRAIAESIKTNSWRYMMHIEPFAGTDQDADARFIGDVRDILKEGTDLTLVGAQATASQITEFMRLVRSELFPSRRSTYVEFRVKDQIRWYSARAAFHQRRARFYFAAGLGAEFFALAWLILRIALSSNLNIIGVFTSVAVAATALSELHAHDGLGQSYAFAAHELAAILALVESSDETKFADYVKDTEGAISREHTMWIAKRD